MPEPSEVSPFASPPPDSALDPFVNPGDQPEPPDAAARGLTRREVRHTATGETFHIWCPPPPKLVFADDTATPRTGKPPVNPTVIYKGFRRTPSPATPA